MLQQVTHASITAAIAALAGPLVMGSDQGAANRLIARLHPIMCDRCGEDGRLPGVRKRRKCARCGSAKYGYKFGTARYWTGWAAPTKAVWVE